MTCHGCSATGADGASGFRIAAWTLQFGYTGEFAFNATGGVGREAAYTDQYVAGATLDLERLAGLKGTTFQLDPHGPHRAQSQ